jgi:hypothetical protein
MNRPFWRATILGAKARTVFGAIEVNVDDIAPVGIFHFEKRFPALNARIRDDDIDFAVAALDLIGDRAQRRDITNVSLDPFAAAAIASDFLDRFNRARPAREPRWKPAKPVRQYQPRSRRRR